jgi:hypothetical protein
MAPGTQTQGGARRRRRDNGPRFQNLDASESAFLLRETEHVATQTYDQKYPELFSRKFIPVNNQVRRSATTYTYARYRQVGVAALLMSYAQNLPRADVFVEEESSSIRPLGAAYGYDINELRAAMEVDKPLDAKKAAAARRSVEVEFDRILANGDSASGLVGMINQPNALGYTIPAGGGGQTAWESKTPLEVLADLNGIVSFVPQSTGEAETVNAILLPRSQHTLIATTPWGVGTDTTILTYFTKNNPNVDVALWPRLDGAGAGGTDRMIAYRRDPMALEAIIPQEFEQFPPQEKGLEYEIPCHARCGGVVFYYPLSMAIGDGI